MVMLRDQFCLLAQETIWRRHFSLHEFLTLTTKPVFVKRWNWKCFSGFVGNRSPLEQLLIYILNIDSFIPSLSYYVIQSYSVCILFVAEKLKKNSLKKFIVGGQHLYWRATQILFHFCYFYLGMLSIFLRNNFHRHLSGLGLTSVRNFGMKCDLTLLLWKAFKTLAITKNSI